MPWPAAQWPILAVGSNRHVAPLELASADEEMRTTASRLPDRGTDCRAPQQVDAHVPSLLSSQHDLNMLTASWAPKVRPLHVTLADLTENESLDQLLLVRRLGNIDNQKVWPFPSRNSIDPLDPGHR